MNSSAAAWASKNRWRHRSTFAAGSSGDGSPVIVRVRSGGGVQLGEDLLGDAEPVVGDRPAAVVGELNDDFDDLLSGHSEVQGGADVAAQLPVGPGQRHRAQRDQFALLDAQVRTGPDLPEQVVD